MKQRKLCSISFARRTLLTAVATGRPRTQAPALRASWLGALGLVRARRATYSTQPDWRVALASSHGEVLTAKEVGLEPQGSVSPCFGPSSVGLTELCPTGPAHSSRGPHGRKQPSSQPRTQQCLEVSRRECGAGRCTIWRTRNLCPWHPAT